MTESTDKGTKSVDFKSTETTEPQPQRGSKTQGRRSSILKQLGRSFKRSGGERGADLATLRGTHGPDFEGEGIINRGGDAVCGCFGGTELKTRLLLIKGPFVFVYSTESDTAPKYAISLAHLTAKFQGPSTGMFLVTLESSLGDVEYEILFKENRAAVLFVTAAKKQAAVGEAEEVRKRLGHESLLSKRSSLMYAETVAMKKVEDQPEKSDNVTTEDVNRVNANFGL